MRAAGMVLLYVDALTTLLFGLRYMTATAVMPYHEAFVASSGGTLPAAVVGLLLVLYKAIGFGYVSLAATTALLATPAARGDRWAWWTLLVSGVISFVPLTAIVLRVGHGAPWWAPPLGFVLLVVALGLVRAARR